VSANRPAIDVERAEHAEMSGVDFPLGAFGGAASRRRWLCNGRNDFLDPW
jgi:hypothetical protein